MKSRFLLFLIFLTFLLSLTTFFLVLNYLDPYENKIIGIFSIIFSFVLSLSSLFTIILYFFKKVYFRGAVGLVNVFTSFRQGFIFSIFLVGFFLFKYLGAPIFISTFSLFFLLSFMELFFQNMQE